MRQQLCHIRTSDATVKRDRGKKETGKRKNETCRQCHDKLARCGSAPALLLHAPSPPAPATALAHTPVCVCARARACLPVCLYACGVRMRAHVCVCVHVGRFGQVGYVPSPALPIPAPPLIFHFSHAGSRSRSLPLSADPTGASTSARARRLVISLLHASASR